MATAASALRVDPAGNAYVVGSTWDPHLPVTAGAFQTTFHGWSEIQDNGPLPAPDAYAIKLNPSGTAVVWGSYLGGDWVDEATAAAIDSAGHLWVAGSTGSTAFPNAQGWSTGGDFVVEFNADGTALPYSGRYPGGSASKTLAIDDTDLLHLATQTGVVSAVAPLPRPAMRPWVVANAASGVAGGQIVPGEVISIYGPHIGAFPAVQATPSGGRMPVTLGAVQVLVNDVPAPLLYASDEQINAVVPFETSGQTARIRIVNQTTTGPEFVAGLLPSDAQVFRTADGAAAALNEDGSINSAANPAKAGSVVAIWLTGIRVQPLLGTPDGTVPEAAGEYACCAVFADGQQLYRPYAGFAPGLVAGVTQVNVQLARTASGPVELVVIEGSGRSQPATVYVEP